MAIVDVSEKTWRSTVEKRSAGLKKEPGQVDVSDSTGRVISLLLCRLCFA